VADRANHDFRLIWKNVMNGAVFADANLLGTGKLSGQRFAINRIEVQCEGI